MRDPRKRQPKRGAVSAASSVIRQRRMNVARTCKVRHFKRLRSATLFRQPPFFATLFLEFRFESIYLLGRETFGRSSISKLIDCAGEAAPRERHAALVLARIFWEIDPSITCNRACRAGV
jgi:hypothetical protein